MEHSHNTRANNGRSPLTKYTEGALTGAAFLFAANLAFALDPLPEESGFSGHIAPGIGVIKYKGNMIAACVGYPVPVLNISPPSTGRQAGEVN
jgi:hypothetical protein